MCGLLILKHLRNLSDESVVEQWSENAYFQYFCGMHEFVPSFPCNSSELVHYRDQRFRNHPKNRKKALKADKRLRIIAGRLVREVKRNLGDNNPYDELLSVFEKMLLQCRNSSHKIYSIH